MRSQARTLPHGRGACARYQRHVGSAPPGERGLGLVELLVGLALGLAITAAALSMLVTTVRSQQQVVIDGRLTEELRMAQDAVSRSLRRSGHWSGAASSVVGAVPVRANPLWEVTATDAHQAVGMHYSRDASVSDAATPDEQVGFRLREGVVQALIGAGRWQALTDPGTLVVTRFQVTPQTRALTLAAACATECPTESTTCPPRLLMRSAAIEIAGHSAHDPAVVRSVQGTVGIRNDAVVGACAP